MNGKVLNIGSGIVVIALAAVSGGLLIPRTVGAWDPNPNRTMLGVTQLQRQIDQQSQMIRQLDRQRSLQNLREQEMSRQLHRQVQTLKERQTDIPIRQELQRGRYGALTGGPAQPPMTMDEAKARLARQKLEAKKEPPNGLEGDLANGVGNEGKAEVKTDTAGSPARARP